MIPWKAAPSLFGFMQIRRRHRSRDRYSPRGGLDGPALSGGVLHQIMVCSLRRTYPIDAIVGRFPGRRADPVCGVVDVAFAGVASEGGIGEERS